MSEEQRRPWWMVTGVFDPEGKGSDFSYTEGLASKGLPELHIWGRPPSGDDPGFDWCLSPRDAGTLLNELAWRLIDGRLAVGDTWEHEYDGGLTVARFEVGAPVEAAEVEAYGAGDAPVLPILWELVRDPVGPPCPMTSEAEAEALALLGQIAGTVEVGETLDGWSFASELQWGPDQEFGPRTSLVQARVAQLVEADTEALWDFIGAVMILGPRRQVGYAMVVARAAVRSVGRVDALDRVAEAAGRLVDDFGTTWGVEALPVLRERFLDGMPAEDRERCWRGALSAFREVVTTFLVVEAAADVTPLQYVTWGQGPALTALSQTVMAPDPRWLCSDSVASAVRTVLVSARPDELVSAALAWDALTGSEAELELEGLRLTGATHAPSWLQVVPMASRVALVPMLAQYPHGAGKLQQWANALAALLSERMALDPATVEVFLGTARHLPAVARLVNDPLVA